MTARELPIIFSGPMVRATRQGLKSQTRRLIKPAPALLRHCGACGLGLAELVACEDPDCGPVVESIAAVKSPRFKVGDRLWVRETYALTRTSLDYETGGEQSDFEWEDDIYGSAKDHLNGNPRGGFAAALYFAADGEDVNPSELYPLTDLRGKLIHKAEIRWRPSIHMPRWTSRTTLRVVDVRVQRLREISEADAIAEGATSRPHCYGAGGRHEGWSMDWSRVGMPSRWGRNGECLAEEDVALGDPISAFASFINGLHDPRWNHKGDGIFGANPPVYAVTYAVEAKS